MQAIWEIYVEAIGAVLFSILRISIFLAEHGIAGVFAGIAFCIAVIVLIAAMVYKLG